jgi:hypothetical protein
MATATFTSPLSFYSVNTYYGEDALSLQPEERIMAAYADSASNTNTAFDGAPFPYFVDVPVGGVASEGSLQVTDGSNFQAFSDTGYAIGNSTSALAGAAAQTIIPTPSFDQFLTVPSTLGELIGTAGDDTIRGKAIDDTLDGGLGHDVLTGGMGADTFIFNLGDGKDTVTEFDTRGADHDVVDLGLDAIGNFADLKDLAHQRGDDVILNFGEGDSLTFQHVNIHDLSRADFIL